MVILSFLRFCWWWWFFDTYRHCCNKLYTITCTSWCFYFYRWHFQGGFAVPTHMFFLFNNFRTWFPNTFLFTMYETGCFPSFLPGLGVLMMVLLLCFSTLQGKKQFHLIICLLASWISSSVIYLFTYFAHFYIIFFAFFLSICSILYNED